VAGRPPTIATPEEFDAKADAYFATCTENEKPVTLTGLVIALGFVSRQSLTDYAAKPEFSDSVKRAKLRVENAYEERLDSQKPTGPIFALKNMGWADKQVLEHTGAEGGPVAIAVTRRVVDPAEPSDGA
jgi:hypothetical protein